MSGKQVNICGACRLPVMPWFKAIITLLGTLGISVAVGSTGGYAAWHVFHTQSAIGTGLLLGLVAGGVIGYKYTHRLQKTPDGGNYCNCSPHYEWGEY